MNEQLKQIKIICAALAIGCTLFLFIVLLFNYFGIIPFAPELNPTIMYVGVALTAGLIAASFSVYNSRSNQCQTSDETEKQNLFRQAYITHFALFEMPALFNIIAYMLGGNNISIVCTGLCILIMLLRMPNEEKYNSFGSM